MLETLLPVQTGKSPIFLLCWIRYNPCPKNRKNLIAPLIFIQKETALALHFRILLSISVHCHAVILCDECYITCSHDNKTHSGLQVMNISLLLMSLLLRQSRAQDKFIQIHSDSFILRTTNIQQRCRGWGRGDDWGSGEELNQCFILLRCNAMHHHIVWIVLYIWSPLAF